MITLHDHHGQALQVRLQHSERMPFQAGEGTGRLGHAHEVDQHIIFYQAGRGKLLMGETWMPVEAGEIWFIEAGVMHTFAAARRNPHTYLEATFTLAPYRPLMELLQELSGLDVPLANPMVPDAAGREDIEGVLNALRRESGHNRSNQSAFEELKIWELMLTLARAHREAADQSARSATAGNMSARELVEQVRLYLRKHYRRPLATQELAAYVGRSSSTVAHTFKKATRRTIGEELRYLRLDRAKGLLRNSDYTIGRIAELCGFGDAAHFSRTFKKAEKLSPRDYRAQIFGGPVQKKTRKRK